eukprot:Hpha_TRINITY_DN8664_c0_g1::TRINITY_DN8664_c0_g1_i1::g.168752::m.168752
MYGAEEEMEHIGAPTQFQSSVPTGPPPLPPPGPGPQAQPETVAYQGGYHEGTYQEPPYQEASPYGGSPYGGAPYQGYHEGAPYPYQGHPRVHEYESPEAQSYGSAYAPPAGQYVPPGGYGRGRGVGALPPGAGGGPPAAKRRMVGPEERRYGSDGSGPWTRQEFDGYYGARAADAWDLADPNVLSGQQPPADQQPPPPPGLQQPQGLPQAPAPLPRKMPPLAPMAPGGRGRGARLPGGRGSGAVKSASPPPGLCSPVVYPPGPAMVAIRGWGRGPPRGVAKYLSNNLMYHTGDRCGLKEVGRDQTTVWLSLRSGESAARLVNMVNHEKKVYQGVYQGLNATVEQGEVPAAAAVASAPKAQMVLKAPVAVAKAKAGRGGVLAAAPVTVDGKRAVKMPPGAPGAGPSWGLGGGEEKRYAPDGGGPYTKAEFIVFYAGTKWDADQEWALAAKRTGPKEKAKKASGHQFLLPDGGTMKWQQPQTFNAAPDLLARKNSRLARFGTGQSASSSSVAAEQGGGWDARDGEFDEEMCRAIEGKCTTLEKCFVRSAAGLLMDPSLVRPVPVLRRALSHILLKQANMPKEKRVVYCREQLKSIRQDLTVQHVFTRFTTEVYEVHARMCIEHEDRGEFVICLAKLNMYHRRPEMMTGLDRVVEFTAYRIIFLACTKQDRELGFEIGALSPELRKTGPIKHALAVCRALSPLSIWEVRSLCRDAPYLCQDLMKMLIKPPHGLIAIIYGMALRAYRPRVPVSDLKELLLFSLGQPDEKLAAQWRMKGGGGGAKDDEGDEGLVVPEPEDDDAADMADDDEDDDPEEQFAEFLTWARCVIKDDSVDTTASLTSFKELQEFLRTRKDFHNDSSGKMEGGYEEPDGSVR